ncbi:inosine/xanthosine triphosphatase [Anoxybacillus flavithermus]|nr:inosine/xanthosine triphosphatase [Anoxybacillus flavithermus]
MKIAVGTKNNTKVKAVKAVFHEAHHTIIASDVQPSVSKQPFSDEETLQGAIERATLAAHEQQAHIGVGLEGGVFVAHNGTVWLCNWGALVDRDGVVVVAGGARIPLPVEISEQLKTGKELAEVIDEYADRRDVRSNEGAIGILTNGAIDRTTMYTHIVHMLKGQYKHQKKGWRNQ